MATTTKIYLGAVTGLSPEVQIYDGSTPVGSPISLTEIGATGNYFAYMPDGVPYGQYYLVATAGDATLASGEMYWDGAYEINQSIAMLRGIDPNNPATQTTTELTSGNITIEVSGDPASSVTFTRQT